MKTAVLCFVIFCACSAFKFDVQSDIARSWADMVTPYIEQCSVEANVSVKEGYAGILTMHFPDTPEYYCLGECIWRQWGFYDPETKTFDYQRIKDHVAGFWKDNTKQCVKQYKHIDGDCEKVFSIIKCGVAKLSKRY